MKLVAAVLAALAASPALCCTDTHDGHGHEHTRRASVPISSPTTPLVWGDINVIHTTDSHGWLLGHQKASAPEPNYSGDFGSFASFVHHMKEEAKRRKVDLLLVDSGDLHDGTGLSDGFPPGGVDAHDSNRFFAELPYDLLAIGNHELYIYANTLDIHQNFAPKWKGRYLSSNVNITLNKHGKNVSVPVGDRFAKFKTAHGRSVTSLGVLFDFTGNDKNTTVQPVAQMVKEAWFKDAIAEEPDLFLLVGHMPVQRDNWSLVFDAIRAVHPTTPITIFGGHTHIRDCVQLDGRSMSLESGRYMETIGWMSAKLGAKHSKENITFSRRYLDPNPVTYEFHTGLKTMRFNTAQGQKISAGLEALAKRFDLSAKFGTAPQDYFINRAPFGSNQSLLSLFTNEVLPTALALNNTRASIPNLIIVNSGSQRFDLYAGAFTKNDQLTVSPFADAFQFLANVSFAVATRVLDELNSSGLPSRKREVMVEELYKKGDVSLRFMQWLQEQWERSTVEKRDAANLTLGYVTQDACPGIGDDVPHAPLPFFGSTDFIGSPTPMINDTTTPMDLVFLDFIQADVLQIVNSLMAASGSSANLTAADVKSYSDLVTSQVFGLFAQIKWN